MATEGIVIRNAVEKTSLVGTEMLPIDDGTTTAKMVKMSTIKDFTKESVIDIGDYTESGTSFTCKDICNKRFIYTDEDGWCYQLAVNKEYDDDENLVVFLHYDKVFFDNGTVRKFVYKYSYNETTGLTTYVGEKVILLT